MESSQKFEIKRLCYFEGKLHPWDSRWDSEFDWTPSDEFCECGEYKLKNLCMCKKCLLYFLLVETMLEVPAIDF